MRAEILSVGTELLLGAITDTNAQYLAQRFTGLGIDCFYISQVGDNQARLVDTLRRAWDRSDLVVTTGGLGPTQDDLTREAIAELLGENLTVLPEQEERLRRFFALRGASMPEGNLKQASLIASATPLDNPIGTAPGWWVERRQGEAQRIIVSMPGVPFEMKRMWECEVEPRLRARSDSVLVSRTLKVLGLGESRVEEMVADLMNGENPTLAPYAKQDGVHLRITAKASVEAEARHMIDGLEKIVRDRLGDAVYGVDADTPESVTARLLADAGTTFAVLEVGSGAIGSIGASLGSLSGSLGVFGVASVQATSTIMGGASPQTLEGAAEALKTFTTADMVIATRSEITPRGEDTDSVTARLELLLLGNVGDERVVRTSQESWRTSATEVRRLVGLAAQNMLRLYLLEEKMVKS
ncbi:MAG: CinA family nicotinamide mononucleotide deamidase-related protein [Chloroflexia bacterium]